MPSKKLITYSDLRVATGYSRKTLSPILNSPEAPARDPSRWPEVLRFIRQEMQGSSEEQNSDEELKQSRIAKLTEDTKRSRWQAEESELRVARLRGELTTVAEVHRECAVIGEITANCVTSFYSQAATLFSDKSPAEIEALATPEAERLIATIDDRLAKVGLAGAAHVAEEAKSEEENAEDDDS